VLVLQSRCGLHHRPRDGGATTRAKFLALTGACRARHCACDALPAALHAPHNADAGLPPRHTVPVRLFRPRSRPPACHRRGRSPLPLPSRDRADGATLGRRTRRPGPRDATERGPLPTSPHAPLPRGHATPPAARLTGRRDARPHNADRKAGAPGRQRSGSNQVQRSATAIGDRNQPSAAEPRSPSLPISSTSACSRCSIWSWPRRWPVRLTRYSAPPRTIPRGRLSSAHGV